MVDSASGKKRVLLVLGLIVLVVAGAVGYVAVEVLGVGPTSPELRALEARNPVLSDLELVAATRISRSASDGSEALGKPTPLHIFQRFEPVDDVTSLEELVAQAAGIAEAEGWDLVQSEQSEFGRIGTKDGTSDKLSIGIAHPSDGREPYVLVTLGD